MFQKDVPEKCSRKMFQKNVPVEPLRVVKEMILTQNDDTLKLS